MLIFISDLHFVDGTAGEHNIPTDAFKIFPMEKLMPYLARVSSRIAEDNNLAAAADEYAHLDNRISYIITGTPTGPNRWQDA